MRGHQEEMKVKGQIQAEELTLQEEGVGLTSLKEKKMKLGGGTEKLVSLAPGLLEYLGPEELTQYYVQKYSISETILKNAKGLRTSITFGRRLLGTILTVYLPTVLLKVIGHATNFFKPFFFEAVVTVNLTGKLLSPKICRLYFFQRCSSSPPCSSMFQTICPRRHMSRLKCSLYPEE